MSVAEWKAEVEVKGTTCDLERHTFFCLEMEIWIERMRGEGREVERRGREALRIFYYRWACCQPFRREGGNRCVLSSAFAFTLLSRETDTKWFYTPTR